jgi:hypothetical protein
MIKEQVLIIRVRYDDEDQKPPHMWDWMSLLNSDHDVEVLNHGNSEAVEKK